VFGEDLTVSAGHGESTDVLASAGTTASKRKTKDGLDTHGSANLLADRKPTEFRRVSLCLGSVLIEHADLIKQILEDCLKETFQDSLHCFLSFDFSMSSLSMRLSPNGPSTPGQSRKKDSSLSKDGNGKGKAMLEIGTFDASSGVILLLDTSNSPEAENLREDIQASVPLASKWNVVSNSPAKLG
jgi:hypothetical protein